MHDIMFRLSLTDSTGRDLAGSLAPGNSIKSYSNNQREFTQNTLAKHCTRAVSPG